MPTERISIDTVDTAGSTRRSVVRKAPKFTTACEMIANSPQLRGRLIAHEVAFDDLGNWDYHKGREINPYGNDPDSPFPIGGIAPSTVP